MEQLGTTTDENVAASVDSVLQQSQFSGQYSKLTMIEFILSKTNGLISYGLSLHLISNLISYFIHSNSAASLSHNPS